MSGSGGALCATLVALGLAVGLGACGGADRPIATSAPPAQPSTTTPEPSAAIVASARSFVAGYLEFQAGTRAANDIPYAAVLLRHALRNTRVPPAQRGRDAVMSSLKVDRMDAASAHVTAEILNRDEALTYPLALELVNARGRWIVQSTGDDE